MNTECIKKKEFLNYINVYRAIAITMIVLGHSFYYYKNPTINFCFSELFRGGTMLFIFIAAYLFEFLTRNNFEYISFLKKKFINVIMPYIVTSAVGITIVLIFPQMNPFHSLNIFVQIPIMLSIGHIHNSPTWFISMITVFFILAPLFRKLSEYINLPVFICLMLLALFFPKPDISPNSTNWLILWGQYLYKNMANFLYYVPVWFLGMYYAKNRNNPDSFIIKTHQRGKETCNITILLFAVYVFASITDIFMFVNSQQHLRISKICLTLFFLSFLFCIDDKIKSAVKLNKMFDIVAKYSFGIFFVHWYMHYLYKFILKHLLHINLDILVTTSSSFISKTLLNFGDFCFMFFGSLIVLFIVKKILEKLGINNTRMFIGV